MNTTTERDITIDGTTHRIPAEVSDVIDELQDLLLQAHGIDIDEDYTRQHVEICPSE